MCKITTNNFDKHIFYLQSELLCLYFYLYSHTELEIFCVTIEGEIQMAAKKKATKKKATKKKATTKKKAKKK